MLSSRAGGVAQVVESFLGKLKTQISNLSTSTNVNIHVSLLLILSSQKEERTWSCKGCSAPL
jgi:hypothetical protein